MKKIFFVFCITLIMCFNVSFASEISLSDTEILLNGIDISNENEEGIIHSNQMNNGSSEDIGKEANIKIDNIITITKPGEYTFRGELLNGQIAVDANKIEGEVRIILDNASITNENAPAIFIYSKDIENDKCKIIIETTKDSINTVTGGKIKQSVIDIKNQDEILYNVEKDYDDERKYYERYKYDGAISSDISITFNGEGILNVNGIGKEGIEGKMHITVDGGTLIIKSIDDAINAAADGKSIITINAGTVIAFLTKEAEEGDGIDSNGSIVINGGKVYSFACPGADSGLDADKGTTINGGEVISTGSMNDTVNFAGGVNSARAIFSVNPNEIVCVVDEKDNIVFAMKTDRRIQNFLYTSKNLTKDNTYTVLTNAEIEGNIDEWGIYTNISSCDITNATKNEFSNMKFPGFNREFNNNQIFIENKDLKTVGIILLIISIILLVVISIIDIKNKDSKMKTINLIFGILIGANLSLGIYFLINTNVTSMYPQRNNMQFPNMQNGNMVQENFENIRGEMKNFEGGKPNMRTQKGNNI